MILASVFALPPVRSAPVFVTHMAFDCFKRGGKDRPSPAESSHEPLRGMEFETVEAVIGRDESAETYSMLYFDSRGVSRIYEMSLEGGVWKTHREAPGFWQRFTATFNDDGTTINGCWEKSSDGSIWELDLNWSYTRIK
jgi:hypothetical protein